MFNFHILKVKIVILDSTQNFEKLQWSCSSAAYFTNWQLLFDKISNHTTQIALPINGSAACYFTKECGSIGDWYISACYANTKTATRLLLQNTKYNWQHTFIGILKEASSVDQDGKEGVSKKLVSKRNNAAHRHTSVQVQLK